MSVKGGGGFAAAGNAADEGVFIELGVCEFSCVNPQLAFRVYSLLVIVSSL
jgi:hypothetical protein